MIDFSVIPHDLHELARALVCAIADPTIVPSLTAAPGAVVAARSALTAGYPILVDSHMVAAGIGQLPSANKIICTLPDSAPEGTTRSSASIDLWCHHLEGAIAVIGNAPTALFRLIEGLFEGWPPPAVILGFPVGFVGAADAKRFLYESNHGVPFITLLGNRGGSPLAAAAVRTLASLPE